MRLAKHFQIVVERREFDHVRAQSATISAETPGAAIRIRWVGDELTDHARWANQTRAEMASRAPVVHAFGTFGADSDFSEAQLTALAAMGLSRPPPPPGTGRGRSGRGGRSGHGGRGQRGGAQDSGGAHTPYPPNPCLRCGSDDHIRTTCTEPKTKCRFCLVGDHQGAYCSKNPTAGAKRRALSQGARDIVARETGSATGPAAAAMDATVTNTVNLTEHAAHAAATAAAGAQVDDVSSANAYAATLKILGYGMCVSVKAMSSVVTRQSAVSNNNQPPMSTLVTAMVDSMATYFVVNKPEYIVRVTNNNPGFTVLTAAGVQPILAVGDAHIWIPDAAGEWKCYEVPNVLLMPACSAVLYSVRVMRDLFGFNHDFNSDKGAISMPNRLRQLPIHDNGSSFAVPIAFSTAAQSVSNLIRSSVGRPAALLTSLGSAFPADSVGTPQSLLYQRLGFPYAQAWRFVGASIGQGSMEGRCSTLHMESCASSAVEGDLEERLISSTQLICGTFNR